MAEPAWQIRRAYVRVTVVVTEHIIGTGPIFLRCHCIHIDMLSNPKDQPDRYPMESSNIRSPSILPIAKGPTSEVPALVAYVVYLPYKF